MKATSSTFRQNSREALLDDDLQQALSKMGFLGARKRVVDALPEWEELRTTAREIKEHTLAHLDFYLEEFEKNVRANGGHVHWCSTPEDASATVLSIPPSSHQAAPSFHRRAHPRSVQTNLHGRSPGASR